MLTLPRRVAPETLDGLAEDDPAAQRSRRDLQRIHRLMGTRRLVTGVLRRWLGRSEAAGAATRPRPGRTAPPKAPTSAAPAAPTARTGGAPWRVLELGAGDGSLLLGVAAAAGGDIGAVDLTLLDRQSLVGTATIDAYAARGWTARPAVLDVQRWAGARTDPLLKGNRGARGRWDLIVANLFLHHFEGPALAALLGAVAARSDRFLACEPRRGALALAGSHLVGVVGANAVTREDAVLSVHAGFRGDELTMLWPKAAAGWRLHEGAAGLFSHCLQAERGAAPRPPR